MADTAFSTPKRMAASMQGNETSPDMALGPAAAKRPRCQIGSQAPRSLKQTSLFSLMRPLGPKGVEAESASLALDSEALASTWVPRLGSSWYSALLVELRRPSMKQLMAQVDELRARQRPAVFPPEPCTYRAFTATPLEAVRVVIVGQDPYHGRGEAMGLSFSVPRGVAVPPSLQNMLREANSWPAAHGDLTSWASQGVLLLNTCLTVFEGQPNSHKKYGWEKFTDAVISAVSRECKGVIFLLWGNEAKVKARLVDTPRHTVLVAGHPSPLSYERHFKGCNHFQKVNTLLEKSGSSPIMWRLPP